MTRRFPAIAACFLAIVSSAGVRAEAPKSGSKQSIPVLSPSQLVPQPTVSLSVFMDAVYDYEVYSAPDVSGQTEFVVMARFADDGEWDYVHRYVWGGTPDHGMYQTDMGVRKFSSSYSARQAAENLLDEGEITDYEIVEQPKEPDWTYEDTFDTRSEAEAFADEFEAWSQTFGAPHITKIVEVGGMKLQTRR